VADPTLRRATERVSVCAVVEARTRQASVHEEAQRKRVARSCHSCVVTMPRRRRYICIMQRDMARANSVADTDPIIKTRVTLAGPATDLEIRPDKNLSRVITRASARASFDWLTSSRRFQLRGSVASRRVRDDYCVVAYRQVKAADARRDREPSPRRRLARYRRIARVQFFPCTSRSATDGEIETRTSVSFLNATSTRHPTERSHVTPLTRAFSRPRERSRGRDVPCLSRNSTDIR